MANTVRLGIIGVGNMGLGHINNAVKGKMPEIAITCVADIDPKKFDKAKELLPDVVCFPTAEALIDSGLCDAVKFTPLMATAMPSLIIYAASSADTIRFSPLSERIRFLSS